jgi:hypothetical protein
VSESVPRPPDSPENPHAGQGAVMLDIGGDIGAVVVTMPVEMVGQEVDILAEGEDVAAGLDHGHDHDHDHGHGHGHRHGHRPHVAVVRRPVPGTGEEIASLVYPEVREGRHRLLMKGTDVVVMEVDVVGGQVTMAEWPA